MNYLWIPLFPSAIISLIALYRSDILREEGEGKQGKLAPESWARLSVLSATVILTTVFTFLIARELALLVVEVKGWPLSLPLIGLFFAVLPLNLLFFGRAVSLGKVTLVERVRKEMCRELAKLEEKLDEHRESANEAEEERSKNIRRVKEMVADLSSEWNVTLNEGTLERLAVMVSEKLEKGREGRPDVLAEKMLERVSESEKTADLIDRIAERIDVKVGGVEQYETGQAFQEKSKQELEEEGFEVEVHKSGRNRADYILTVDGEIVACAGARRRKVKRSRTLTWADFQAGLDNAREQEVPFIIWWWNHTTSRRWIKVIETEELSEVDKDKFKLTVPTWLWHEELDQQEARERKEEQREAKKRIRELANGE